MRQYLQVIAKAVQGLMSWQKSRSIFSQGPYRDRGGSRANPVLKMLPFLIVLAIAYALKYHYSRTDSDGLRWILFPVAKLVESLGGLSFQYESTAGYVDYAREVIIAPGCAGINFMIVAFLMIGFALPSLSRRFTGQLAWIGGAAASAYILTLLANTLRIMVAIQLYQADIYNHWVTPDRVHRLAGIGVYLLLLCGFHWMMASFIKWRLVGKPPAWGGVGKRLKSTSPILWYLAVTIGMPIANGIGTHQTDFNWEHYATIFGGALFVFLWIDLVHRSRTHAKGHWFDGGPAMLPKKECG